MQELFWHKFGQNPLSGYWDLVTAAISESQTAKKYNGFIQETVWHKVGSISTNG